jgi:hypothetical protein
MEEQLAHQLLKLLEEYGRNHPPDGTGAPASLVSLAVLGGGLLLRVAINYLKRRLDTHSSSLEEHSIDIEDIQDRLDALDGGATSKKKPRRVAKPR